MSTLGIIKITEAERLETAKDLIVEHRAKAGAKASYELYGLDYNNGRPRLKLVARAPTSADFGPCTSKRSIASLVDVFNMVVEFRGAWKTDAEAKVVAYESTLQASINAAK